ncbi:hypothetical protein CEUSTIGMA_g2097.t1 [Chlamydomonas eustigma]|uniref:Uncharacterized protein n=1 Tax=Chlamydomonas eustigma TaxID=1157962 RepID=A0A250WVB3_9CHLO|nr:hypothetical protein CEUSTIGMA_g2097.t1 [Chlamydomonas eustigma]|eukprot:GAX74649.1 hypothetical protein CEUSTIGMA_g2097.t1 [Chlamydomonas eustigma]
MKAVDVGLSRPLQDVIPETPLEMGATPLGKAARRQQALEMEGMVPPFCAAVMAAPMDDNATMLNSDLCGLVSAGVTGPVAVKEAPTTWFMPAGRRVVAMRREPPQPGTAGAAAAAAAATAGSQQAIPQCQQAAQQESQLNCPSSAAVMSSPHQGSVARGLSEPCEVSGAKVGALECEVEEEEDREALLPPEDACSPCDGSRGSRKDMVLNAVLRPSAAAAAIRLPGNSPLVAGGAAPPSTGIGFFGKAERHKKYKIALDKEKNAATYKPSKAAASAAPFKQKSGAAVNIDIRPALSLQQKSGAAVKIDIRPALSLQQNAQHCPAAQQYNQSKIPTFQGTVRIQSMGHSTELNSHTIKCKAVQGASLSDLKAVQGASLSDLQQQPAEMQLSCKDGKAASLNTPEVFPLGCSAAAEPYSAASEGGEMGLNSKAAAEPYSAASEGGEMGLNSKAAASDAAATHHAADSALLLLHIQESIHLAVDTAATTATVVTVNHDPNIDIAKACVAPAADTELMTRMENPHHDDAAFPKSVEVQLTSGPVSAHSVIQGVGVDGNTATQMTVAEAAVLPASGAVPAASLALLSMEKRSEEIEEGEERAENNSLEYAEIKGFIVLIAVRKEEVPVVCKQKRARRSEAATRDCSDPTAAATRDCSDPTAAATRDCSDPTAAATRDCSDPTDSMFATSMMNGDQAGVSRRGTGGKSDQAGVSRRGTGRSSEAGSTAAAALSLQQPEGDQSVPDNTLGKNKGSANEGSAVATGELQGPGTEPSCLVASGCSNPVRASTFEEVVTTEALPVTAYDHDLTRQMLEVVSSPHPETATAAGESQWAEGTAPPSRNSKRKSAAKATPEGPAADASWQFIEAPLSHFKKQKLADMPSPPAADADPAVLPSMPRCTGSMTEEAAVMPSPPAAAGEAAPSQPVSAPRTRAKAKQVANISSPPAADADPAVLPSMPLCTGSMTEEAAVMPSPPAAAGEAAPSQPVPAPRTRAKAKQVANISSPPAADADPAVLLVSVLSSKSRRHRFDSTSSPTGADTTAAAAAAHAATATAVEHGGPSTNKIRSKKTRKHAGVKPLLAAPPASEFRGDQPLEYLHDAGDEPLEYLHDAGDEPLEYLHDAGDEPLEYLHDAGDQPLEYLHDAGDQPAVGDDDPGTAGMVMSEEYLCGQTNAAECSPEILLKGCGDNQEGHGRRRDRKKKDCKGRKSRRQDNRKDKNRSPCTPVIVLSAEDGSSNAQQAPPGEGDARDYVSLKADEGSVPPALTAQPSSSQEPKSRRRSARKAVLQESTSPAPQPIRGGASTKISPATMLQPKPNTEAEELVLQAGKTSRKERSRGIRALPPLPEERQDEEEEHLRSHSPVARKQKKRETGITPAAKSRKREKDVPLLMEEDADIASTRRRKKLKN